MSKANQQTLRLLGCLVCSQLLRRTSSSWRDQAMRELRIGPVRGRSALSGSNPYVPTASWSKIRNRMYSQWVGREALFERERHKEPAAPWRALNWGRLSKISLLQSGRRRRACALASVRRSNGLRDLEPSRYERPASALNRLGWKDVNFAAGRYGTLFVRFGKTDAARRQLPLTARVRCILSARHISAGSPQQGWVFPAPTADGHINHDSLKRLTLRPCACPRFSRS